MKYTKVLLSLLALALVAMTAFSQNGPQRKTQTITAASKIAAPSKDDEPHIRCGAGNVSSLLCDVRSTEINSLTGSFDFTFRIEALDTTWVDSLRFEDASIFGLQVKTNFGGTYLLPGQKDSCIITASYNPASLPYYPKFLRAAVHTRSIDTATRDTFVGRSTPEWVFYFTPYNTIEVWRMEDFDNLPRQWSIEKTPAPARVFIPRDSIPTSNRPPLDSITEEWQTNYRLAFVPGLPFAVEMAAAHPDSLEPNRNYDSMEFRKVTIGPTTTFNGTVSGILSLEYENDRGELVTVYPNGIEILLKEDDGALGIPDDMGSCITRRNGTQDGYFEIPYSIVQADWWEGNDIEPYIKIKSRIPGFKITAHKRPIPVVGGDMQEHFFTLDEVDKDGKNNGTVRNQNLWLNLDGKSYKHIWQALHYANNAYTFVRKHCSSSELPDGLWLRMRNQTSPSSHYEPIILGHLEPAIKVQLGDGKFEGVIYHEFGHHLMNRLQQGYAISGASRSHPWDEEFNTKLVWYEGFGYGIAGILDLAYRAEDNGEFDMCLADPQEKFEPLERRRHAKFAGNAKNTNGIRSEYYIACAMYDLFDGPDNFPDFNNTGVKDEYYDDFTDVDLSDDNTPKIGNKFLDGKDEVCLSFRDIVQPLINTKGGNNLSNNWIRRANAL